MTTTTFLGDKPIKRIGFGALQLAGPGVFGPPRDPDAARAVLRRAIELGVDHIDTSQYYGPDVCGAIRWRSTPTWSFDLITRRSRVRIPPPLLDAEAPALGPPVRRTPASIKPGTCFGR